MHIPESEPTGGLPEEMINRNWTELVQELRSTQTGVQVLTGFLLTVPFSDRFGSAVNPPEPGRSSTPNP